MYTAAVMMAIVASTAGRTNAQSEDKMLVMSEQESSTTGQHVGAGPADYDFAGVALHASPSESITSVSATFALPKPSTPVGGSSLMHYRLALWIGM